MRRWDGATPPKHKFPAPTKHRPLAPWRLFLLSLAIVTPHCRCLSRRSLSGGSCICAWIPDGTLCAPIRAFKSSWHKRLQLIRSRELQVRPVAVCLESTGKGRGASAIPARARRTPPFLCNASQGFGEEWETVCVSGLPEAKTTNPKQRKKSYCEKQKKYPDLHHPRRRHPCDFGEFIAGRTAAKLHRHAYARRVHLLCRPDPGPASLLG